MVKNNPLYYHIFVNLIKNSCLFISVGFLLVLTSSVSGQVDKSTQAEDSLLKKIREMDVSLTSLDDDDEDLYMMTVSFQSFYDELSPAGEWLEISQDEIKEDLKDGEGEGLASDIMEEDGMIYIWRPAGIKSDWHPYLNGRWVYTAQGWLWASNYSWGWAVYHYGRWWNSKTFGWVWLPGYVWAPAWVRWKVTEGHIGWCPLSPYAKWRISEGITLYNYHYTHRDEDWVFVNKSKFAEEISSSERIAVNENGSYIKSSQDILNLKYENQGVQNLGPEVREIESKTGKQIVRRDLVLSETKVEPLAGERDILIYKENFRKLQIDPSTGKPKIIDRPKVFKIARKIKKHAWKKRIRHRLHRIKRRF